MESPQTSSSLFLNEKELDTVIVSLHLQGQLSPSHGLELQQSQPAPNACALSYLSPTALGLGGITALGHLGGSSCRDSVPTRGCPDLAKGIYRYRLNQDVVLHLMHRYLREFT